MSASFFATVLMALVGGVPPAAPPLAVTFDGKPVAVQEMRVSAIPRNRFWNGEQRPLEQTKKAYFAQVESRWGGEIALSDGQRQRKDGHGTCTFDVDGGKTQLHVFVEPRWKYVAQPNDIYFGPGEHFPGVIAPEDGQRVVLDRGAIVHGTIFVFRKRNVTVTGRGILDLSDLNRADSTSKIWKYVKSLGLPEVERKGRPETDANMSCTALVAYGCENLKVEGIVIRDAPRWTMQIRNGCRRVDVDGVKILGSWRYNNDGIDICSSSEVTVRNCFVRTYDDNVVVRGPWLEGETADCRDILVEDCTFWCDWGKTFTIATADKDVTVENVTMRRCRVEHATHAVCDVVTHHGTRKTVVRNVLCDDIEVVRRADAREPMLETDPNAGSLSPAKELPLVVVKTGDLGRDLGNQRRGAAERPDFYHIDYDNLVFRNFRLDGAGATPVTAYLATTVPRHVITNLCFSNMPQEMSVVCAPGSQVYWRKPCGALAEVPGLGKLGFSLALGKPNQLAPSQEVRAQDMTSFRAEPDGRGGRRFVWRGHPICGPDFAVTATVAKDGTYAFRYDGNASDFDVEWISFPELTLPRTDATKILYPVQSGMVRLPKWAQARPGEEVASCGPLFQGFKFVALLNGEDVSHYLDLRGESRLETTRFRFFKGLEQDTVRVAAQHLKPQTAATRRAFALPYGGIMRTFRGGWFDAAAIYRAWAKTTPWYAAAKRRFAGNVRLRDIALWFWNRGTSETVLPPVERARADAGVPMALDWYWWHQNAYGMEGPYYWPPREPVERFTATVRRMKDLGIYSQVYVNGMLSDCDDPRYSDEFRREVRVRRDGSDDIWLFNPFLGRSSAWNCGEAPNFHAFHARQTETLAATGLDAIYYDMIANDAAGGCWSPHHAHPRGGGAFMVDGYRKMIAEIRRRAPQCDLSSEEETESFLEDFDSLIVLYADYERLGRGVAPDVEMPPVYPAIYHGATCLYGSYAVIDNLQPWDEKWPADRKRRQEKDWASLYPDQFAVDFARPVVWGLQPTVHQLLERHMTAAKYADDYRFVIETAKFYHANRDYLLDGEMCHPGTLACATRKVDFLCRGVYAADGEYRTLMQPALPTVFHSVWREPLGRVAAVLVNWTREPQAYDLKTPDITVRGELPPRTWRLVTGVDTGARVEREFAADNRLLIALDCEQPDRRPIVFGGESRAEGAYFIDYCLYLDVQYDDGSWDYKHRAIFTEGTHDWERQNGVFYPKKPVRRIQLTPLAREGVGRVRFRNVFVHRGDPERVATQTRRLTGRPFSAGDELMCLYSKGTPRVDFIPVRDGARTVGPVSPLSNGTFRVWTADSMTKVSPLTFPSDDAAGGGLALELARGEREAAQVLVSTAADLRLDDVSLEIEALRNEGGIALDGDVAWERLGYLSRVPEYEPHPQAIGARERWLPEVLLPAAPMSVRHGATQGAWVTVRAARTAAPGDYSGWIRVRQGGRTLGRVRLSVRVWNFSLPERFGLNTHVCLMDGFLKRLYGEGERYRRMKRQAVDLVLDHRLNVTDISRTQLPDVDELAYAKSRGANSAAILNLVPPAKKGEDWVCFASKESVFCDSFYAAVTNRLMPYCAELRARGLMDMACLYGFDERPRDYYEGIDKMWRRLKRDIPDLPLMTSAFMFKDRVKAGREIPFWRTTDWHVPPTGSYRSDLADDLRKEGKKVFFYTCCGPRFPYWNFASLEYPLIEGRLMGWMVARERADGFLFWALDFWANTRTPLDERDVYFPGWSAFSGLQCPGDGVMTYPGRDHVLGSIRLANLRDAVEDYECLTMAAHVDAAAVEAVVAEVAKSQTDFTRDPRVVRRARRALAAIIEGGSRR